MTEERLSEIEAALRNHIENVSNRFSMEKHPIVADAEELSAEVRRQRALLDKACAFSEGLGVYIRRDDDPDNPDTPIRWKIVGRGWILTCHGTWEEDRKDDPERTARKLYGTYEEAYEAFDRLCPVETTEDTNDPE